MTKLTLSVDEAIVQKAKDIAEANQTSVSAMFSRFVQSVDVPPKRRRKIGPLTRKASRLLKPPPKGDYKQLLTDALLERYGVSK